MQILNAEETFSWTAPVSLETPHADHQPPELAESGGISPVWVSSTGNLLELSESRKKGIEIKKHIHHEIKFIDKEIV